MKRGAGAMGLGPWDQGRERPNFRRRYYTNIYNLIYIMGTRGTVP